MNELLLELNNGVLVFRPRYKIKNILSGLHISTYAMDNFNFVCNVSKDSSTSRWYYTDINEDIMYEQHYSWLYFITVDDIIYKIGETSKPLGVRSTSDQIQPNTGSNSRLGRYIDGDGTDRNIRNLAQEYLELGHNISIYAKKLEIIDSTCVIGGITSPVTWTSHKDQELQYIDHYVSMFNKSPEWNKYRK